MTDETTPTRAAIYARVSTADQDTDSQREVCERHAENHSDIDAWTCYDDVQSGHDDDRPDYLRMKADIADGQYDYFICSEFSRISRNDGEIKAFIADCLDRQMGIEIVQSSFSVSPDADAINRQAMKIVADTLANIATMENLQKIDRINRGISHAREVGKWTRKPPAGFEVNEKYLQVNVEEFLAIRRALLDHYYNGTSWSELAMNTEASRTTLSRIYQDEARRRLYVHGEGWDDWNRDDQALLEADLPDHVDADSGEIAALKDANLKTYLQLVSHEVPDSITPGREPRRMKAEDDAEDVSRLLDAVLFAAQKQVEYDGTLTQDDVMGMYADKLEDEGRDVPDAFR